MIKNDFSIIPELSAKIFGSYLQGAAIFPQSVREKDIITFSPKESQLTMSQQIIITSRNQSHTKFIVFSTINFESMTTGDMIELDFDNSTANEIKYSNQRHVM